MISLVVLDNSEYKSKPSRYVSLKGVSERERSQIMVSKVSKYEDNIWDLSLEYPQLPVCTVQMKFELLSTDDGESITMLKYEGYLRSIKEYCYSLLVDPPSSHPKWSTCCLALRKGVRTLVRFMIRNGISKFSDLTTHDFEEFLAEVASTQNKSGNAISNKTLRTRLHSISWLYEQSPKISDGIMVWPFPSSNSASEWANENGEVKLPRKSGNTPDMPDSVAAKLLNQALADLELINVIKEIRQKISTHQYKKKQTVSINDAGETKYSVHRSNPFPWNSYGMESAQGLRNLTSRLYTACYIVISLLTGMRYHEIMHIKHGRVNNWKVSAVSTSEGIRNIYCVISSTNKLQANVTDYSWQTVPIVEAAIATLEECFRARYDAGNKRLFASSIRGGRLSATAINTNLRKFAEHHNISYEGKVWFPATHQFRKKFARIMVRQGLGLVALQDQLKHFDIEMTKSYGDMNMYAELQQEKFELSKEKYRELLGSTQPIIGGGAPEIVQYRKRFVGMIAIEKERFLDTLPAKAVIEQVDDGLCMFRPNKALCGGDKGNCRPADCNNSVMPAASIRRTLVWRKNENRRLLGFVKNSPLKSGYLKGRLLEIEKLLVQLDAAEGN